MLGPGTKSDGLVWTSRERSRMGDTFAVDCPGCGMTKGPISVHAGTVGIHCSCGVTAIVDIEAKAIDEWWERD